LQKKSLAVHSKIPIESSLTQYEQSRPQIPRSWRLRECRLFPQRHAAALVRTALIRDARLPSGAARGQAAEPSRGFISWVYTEQEKGDISTRRHMNRLAGESKGYIPVGARVGRQTGCSPY
jgi:hypothetical protein